MRLTAAATVATGLLALPGLAEADTCTVSVTLAGGHTLSFQVNVPSGTPLSAINLPVTGTVVAVSESCASAPAGTTTGPAIALTPATTTTETSTTGTATSGTATTQSATTGTATTPGRKRHKATARPLTVTLQPESTTPAPTVTKTSKVNTTPVTTLTAAGGVPSPSNPTYSFALPGAAPIGVPNFFIDSFQIPPFLLPIYQAAGIEYNVPWQVLAAINWIETDYGRDLSVSSAGAVGWMQFLPSTWARWGVDATGTGYADPYNPTDAIFAAARYLSAAGASTDLAKAIFAYNHANWYVQSVLLRAQLIGGMPSNLVSALTGLVQGHFPVAAAATYADDSVVKRAGQRIHGANAAIPVDSGAAKGTNIYAKVGSPVIAVNDGRIVAIGDDAARGRYIVLQDDEGNTYTYSHLGSIPALYPVPKPVSTSRAQLAQELATIRTTSSGHAAASAPATAGLQPDATLTVATTTVPVAAGAGHASRQTLRSLRSPTLRRSSAQTAARAKRTGSRHSAPDATQAVAKERLFANPARPASYAAGGKLQLLSEGAAIANFSDYFSSVLHLARDQYTLAPLTRGAVVVAGTILGRIGPGSNGESPHVYFQIQPAGANAPYIDPKPVLDGWKLLQATAIYRASGLNPFLSSGRQATIGQILLESKSQLQEQVLKDPRIAIYSCGRRDIAAGLVDRRVLATMEFLAASGLDPTVSGLVCGAGSNGIDAAGRTGASMDISAINNIPIAGNQGPGSITDITIRRLLTLQGAMAPAEIVSAMSYKGQANTLALPDHTNRIQVTFTPRFGSNRKLAAEVRSILKPSQWIQLISHISEIPEPAVPTTRSAYAIKTNTQ
ncbi:lytic murein transglycosylase [Conexibacter sp. DBS9H8]|uniref:lytic murein transglycosylase n=1 Tax=Conexibacter sp. DBS9H8 TaxID=2937801 RepID=UPI00200BCF07|nr:lytic murein transglycosylase [Conexibacter sp. DBS9H8]